MWNRSKKALLLCGLLSSSTVFAVNGAYDYGFSEITRGMGGAGSALPQDTLIAAVNPAGMVDVGKRFDIGAMVYFPTISYNASTFSPGSIGVNNIAVAPGFHNSSVPIFFLPDMGVNFPINHKSALGLSFYSLGGFGAQFKGASNASVGGTSSAGPLGNGTMMSDLKQSVASVTYSRKFLSRSSWGVSLLLGLQAFKNEGVANLANLSAHPNNISAQGTDFSTGAGARPEVSPRIST